MQEQTEPAFTEDQSESLAFLGDPRTHGLNSPVVRIDTHAAAVFLCGSDAYKMKRAVKFPFLDFSTLERRRSACEAEVTVNAKYAPELYLGTVPITREQGKLSLGGDGPAVEWVVHLRRFDENQTLDHVADRGELKSGLIARLAELVLATYAQAEVKDGERATVTLEETIGETVNELQTMGKVFPAERAVRLAHKTHDAFEAARQLLLSRGRNGLVRRCHGDVHLRNVVLLKNGPTLFDAIEFDEAIATTDILYDFAFLLMDVWVRSLRSEANLLLNRYLWGSPGLIEELEGLAALPLFLSLRAAVRAKVTALRCPQLEQASEARLQAKRYFDAAMSFLDPAPLSLIAIGGLSGTGKSTLAGKIAPLVGRAPGAVHLRSDIERKRLFNVGELDHLPQTAYRPEISFEMYRSLRRQAETALQAGQSVIMDAVHQAPEDRTAIAAVAKQVGARFFGLWLDAPLDLLTSRVTTRDGDASDATPAVVAGQARQPIGEIEWLRLDASMPIDSLVAAVLSHCGATVGAAQSAALASDRLPDG